MCKWTLGSRSPPVLIVALWDLMASRPTKAVLPRLHGSQQQDRALWLRDPGLEYYAAAEPAVGQQAQ